MVCIDNQEYLDFSDVLIRPIISDVSSRSEVNLEVTFNKPINNKTTDISWTGVPIIASNMSTIGTFKVSNILSKYKMLTFLHKYNSLEDYKKNDYDSEYVGVSSGCSRQDFEKLKSIISYNNNIKFICLDVANGYMVDFGAFVEGISKLFSEKFIVAGNVCTTEGVEFLHNSGADYIKFGIGNGSVCTTRLKTGVGIPQFTGLYKSISEYRRANLISDGGCKNPGDIAKAFGVGSKFVMLGGLLAGHDETGDNFYGMSSTESMNNYSGGVKNYKTSEGKSIKLSSKGRLEDTILDILGGLRSTCAYRSAYTLSEIIGNVEFVKVRRQVNDLFD